MPFIVDMAPPSKNCKRRQWKLVPHQATNEVRAGRGRTEEEEMGRER
jgi:hypothetical protein